VRRTLGKILNDVRYRRSRVLIAKAGRPVAALIDMALFDKLRKLDEEFEQLTASLRKAFSKSPSQKGMALIDEAVRAARGKRAPK
jgi:prevent-host-death family protein